MGATDASSRRNFPILQSNSSPARRRMSPKSALAELLRLIEDSLYPYNELQPNSSTKGIEKDLLIALSRVLAQVKLWTNDFRSNSSSPCGFNANKESVIQPGDNSEFSVVSIPQSENCQCLITIINTLMGILTFGNPYIQHLVENTLAAISGFLIISESCWDECMRLMCLCLELGIHSSLPLSLVTCSSKAKERDCDSFRSTSELKLNNANWSTTASIIRVLRNILKLLKRDFNCQVLKGYLDAVSHLISTVPWDLLSDVYTGQDAESSRGYHGDIWRHRNIVRHRDITMFYGNLLQFFCSLTDGISLMKAEVDSLHSDPIIFQISNLVPKLLAWCHSELETSNNVSICLYFRHKLLMLMIKISRLIDIEHTVSLSWLHLIQKYFEDLLLQPICRDKLNQDQTLEDSPFSASVSGPGKRTTSDHLQRLVVFLFLKCSLNLVNIKENTISEQCLCDITRSCLTFEPSRELECCSRRKAMLELHKWLQAQCRADVFVDHESYSERHLTFASSFLQLYMHEDDLLFNMLLQLFNIPFYPEHQIRGGPLSEVKNSVPLLFSDVFNPTFLFHLFLAEIRYDHQVLLDYLISKDTGTSCAEYLLRALRIVCNSWNSFIQFPGVEDLDHSFPKRRKILAGVSDMEEVISSRKIKNDGTSALFNMDSMSVHIDSSNPCSNYRQPFAAARNCLVSLRTSIESLHQKNLFPYNPRVLLRRLMRFEELCTEE